MGWRSERSRLEPILLLVPVPPEPRLRRDQERRPALPAQEPARRREEQTVARAELRPSHLATQDAELVAQDLDLDILGRLARPACKPEESTQQEVED